MPLSEGDHVTLKVMHKTSISYSEPVSDSQYELHMSPVDTGLQRVLSHHLAVTPTTEIKTHRDHFGNCVTYFDLPESHESMEIIASSEVQTTNAISCGPESAPDPRPYHQRWQEFLQWSPGVPELAEYGSIEIPRMLSMDMDDIEFGHGLYEIACYFYKNFRYDPDVARARSGPEELFEHGAGTCQDMAHAMIGVLRKAEIPSRYASGYVFDPAQGSIGEHLHGAAAPHAWVQAWHEDYGWMGVDPTNKKLVDWQYVRTAMGRDYFDVLPHRGTFRGSASQSVDVAVHIEMLDSDQNR